MKNLLTGAIALIGLNAFAGQGGNGADAVVCFAKQDLIETMKLVQGLESIKVDPFSDINVSQKIESVSLLDFWENQSLLGNTQKSASEIVSKKLEEIGSYSRRVKESIENGRDNLNIINTGLLPEVNDEGVNIILPSNCLKTQLAVQYVVDGKDDLYIRESLYNLMNEQNKAALLFHEYLYNVAQNDYLSNTENSQGVRFFNQYIWADGISSSQELWVEFANVNKRFRNTTLGWIFLSDRTRIKQVHGLLSYKYEATLLEDKDMFLSDNESLSYKLLRGTIIRFRTQKVKEDPLRYYERGEITLRQHDVLKSSSQTLEVVSKACWIRPSHLKGHNIASNCSFKSQGYIFRISRAKNCFYRNRARHAWKIDSFGGEPFRKIQVCLLKYANDGRYVPELPGHPPYLSENPIKAEKIVWMEENGKITNTENIRPEIERFALNGSPSKEVTINFTSFKCTKFTIGAGKVKNCTISLDYRITSGQLGLFTPSQLSHAKERREVCKNVRGEKASCYFSGSKPLQLIPQWSLSGRLGRFKTSEDVYILRDGWRMTSPDWRYPKKPVTLLDKFRYKTQNYTEKLLGDKSYSHLVLYRFHERSREFKKNKEMIRYLERSRCSTNFISTKRSKGVSQGATGNGPNRIFTIDCLNN